jgi:NADPH2:quinone reductase
VRAVVCPCHDPPNVVRVEECPTPTPAAGQVRVRVGAAAVNFPDVLLIADEYQISVPPPFVPGSEFAGVVDEVGDPASDFVVGDRVTGTGLYGAFAEELVVPTTGLHRIPPGIDDRIAAGIGVAYRTAYHTLRSVARIQAGELAALLASRRVLPHIGAVYPLHATADALRLVADGRAIGKVLLDLVRAPSWPGSGLRRPTDGPSSRSGRSR